MFEFVRGGVRVGGGVGPGFGIGVGISHGVRLPCPPESRSKP